MSYWRTVLLMTVAAMSLLTSCSIAGSDDSQSDVERYSHWDKDMGPAEVAGFMKVKVPVGATEVKGAVRVNPREDTYLLSFITDEENAAEVAADLRSEEPLLPSDHNVAPKGENFRHLGLDESENLKGVRWVGVCPPCVEDERRKAQVSWIEAYVQSQGQGKARVYLKAF
ncbi:hypothetical protein [Streptomyces albipurpureus]|uniref:Lipoprotein n=1 Tax=Streptomyces albipurpureus TaxID=2897419 RepID=A0ABT0UX08_9ACTN|nr:hypothetical protein [Streptomyces sp. CWNU-1]MCM2393112.1 hypothetical protein [Streptomyces sp. CWNU-1]